MKNSLGLLTKLLLILAAAGMFTVLFVPMWRIELDAPQYPEGLTLRIHANGIRGNVDIVNGLNHYIGMKTLHSEDFPEFTILPYCIIFFAAALIFVVLANKKKWVYILCGTFVLFGIVSMVDFWRWEYNYGHNLNPDAAIVVPGMAYQPPLIGFKQLLNFGAYSIPDTGGWIFLGVGLILVFATIYERFYLQRSMATASVIKTAVAAGIMLLFTACNAGPQPIKPGKDVCTFCKMMITDARFGAELLTTKGKVNKLDDTHCLLAYIQDKNFEQSRVKSYYFTDFTNDHGLIESDKASFLHSQAFNSPMQGKTAAFNSMPDLESFKDQYPGSVLTWDELQNQ